VVRLCVNSSRFCVESPESSCTALSLAFYCAIEFFTCWVFMLGTRGEPVLGILAPTLLVLAVWVRNLMTVGYTTPFNGDDNVFKLRRSLCSLIARVAAGALYFCAENECSSWRSRPRINIRHSTRSYIFLQQGVEKINTISH
jgi:hypothetical protein